MKYLSLFSGIGGFEVAIHRIFPNSECIGYSEVKPSAIKVYSHHYPTHNNLGDISKIKNKDIINLVREKGCDLIVGGFPCKNLSSLASIRGDNSGLKGKQSGLFYEMIRIIKLVKKINSNVYIILENNASMTNINKKLISDYLNKIYPCIENNILNSADFGVQWRKRIFWTNFKVLKNNIECSQKWNDVLEPLDICFKYISSDKMIESKNKKYPSKTINSYKIAKKNNNLYTFIIKKDYYKTRWDMGFTSDNMEKKLYPYNVGKSRPIITEGGGNNIIIDRRIGNKGEFIIRKITPKEKERLFRLPDNYTNIKLSDTIRGELLGNSVVTKVIEHILKNIKNIKATKPRNQVQEDSEAGFC